MSSPALSKSHASSEGNLKSINVLAKRTDMKIKGKAITEYQGLGRT